MSRSDQTPRIPLHIRAADLGTEIFLVDAGLNRINSAVGEMRAEVVPGLYKIRFRSGGTMRDSLVEVPTVLPPGQSSVLVEGQPLQFASAMPLDDTRTTHEYHRAAWSRASLDPDKRIGAGAFLFVLARDPEKIPGKATSHRPWNGLSLHSTGAEPAMELEFSDAPYRDEDLGVATAHLEVDPGTYLLRVDTGLWGIREMAIHASAGWQTQIFLSSSSLQRTRYDSQKSFSEPARTRTARRVDLSSAAVLMVRPGNSVDPSEPQWRLTELARQGLAQNRNTVRADDLRDMLWAKFDNPMLGLFGAALMLRSEKSGGFLRDVVGNLSSLLPDHPDVAALRLATGLQNQANTGLYRTYPLPPMLLENWQRLIQSSIDLPELIPAGSPSAAIGGSYYSEGPWLGWQRTPEIARAFQNFTLAEQAPQVSGKDREMQTAVKSYQATLTGSGAIAQGPGSIAVGAGSVFVGGKNIGTINTSSGAYIAGNVDTDGGDFDGRDRSAIPGSSLKGLLRDLAERFDPRSLREGDLADKLTPSEFALIRELPAAFRVEADDRMAWLVRNLGIPETSLVQTARKLLSGDQRRGSTRKK